LKGLLVAVPRSQLPAQPEDEYYWSDLIGLSVINEAGVNLGNVEQLLETGANQVLMVKGESGQILIPFVASAIKQVDVQNKLIKVDWAADYLT
jgi:16S rRNA processing protein RimM